MKGAKMQKKRQDIRFEKEAKALQKNLEKRKIQQKKREELKNTKNKNAVDKID